MDGLPIRLNNNPSAASDPAIFTLSFNNRAHVGRHRKIFGRPVDYRWRCIGPNMPKLSNI